jgi:predicted secreted Zn-dependent protease
MAVDPGDGTALEDPQSWNRYAYSRNNPLKYVDPNGEEPVVSVNYDYYPVSGNTASEAWSNAIAANPDGFPGHTSWDINISSISSLEVSTPDLGSAVSIPTDVTVSVDITISLPAWVAPPDAPEGEQASFNQAKSSVNKHEQGHQAIAVQGGRALEQQVMGTVGTAQGTTPAGAESSAKRDLHKKAGAAQKEQKAKTAQKQKDYDTKTDHGRKKTQ